MANRMLPKKNLSLEDKHGLANSAYANQHKKKEVAKKMSKKAMGHAEKGNLGGFMKQFYPKD